MSRRFFALVSLMLAAVWGAACDSDDQFEVRNTDSFAEEVFSFQLPVDQRERLDLVGINGRVQVTGVPGGTVIQIDAIRRVESESTSDARANLSRLRVIVSEEATAIRVRTDQPRNPGGRNFIVNYAITVPANLAVNLVNVNGEIGIVSLRNICDVENVNGNVELEDLEGSATVALVNGAIEASASLIQNGVLDLQTVNGNVDLSIPDDTSAELSASVVNGSIEMTHLSMSDVVQTPRSLSGTLGDGDATITLATVNGAIRIEGR